MLSSAHAVVRLPKVPGGRGLLTMSNLAGQMREETTPFFGSRVFTITIFI
jgi:hypothetical protein